MSSAPNSKPGWQKSVFVLFGWLLIISAPLGLAWLGFNCWQLAHTKRGLLGSSPETLEKLAGELIGSFLVFFIGIWLKNLGTKNQTVEPETDLVASPLTTSASARVRMASTRWQSCNVLKWSATNRRLWNYNASKNGFNLVQEQALPLDKSLPLSVVGRDWKTLIQPKLNIAWLPVDQVFLRVAQLPLSDHAETLSMVELQLEKFSPLPVTQIVWSIYILPKPVDNLQTVIVVIVSREVVEKFLGDLEGQGYLAERLEIPLLDQLQATNIKHDGAFLYPDVADDKFSALVAWWSDGILRNLGLLHVPAGEGAAAVLKEQLTQMAWAGELEGWMPAAPRWSLVADQATADRWLPIFQEGLGQFPELIPPLSETQLATLTANRAARSEPGSSIMPPEYATRYQQEFVDRLWMRGLGAVLVIYLAFVIIYLGGAAVQNYRAEGAVQETTGLARTYTNTLQLKAQLEILQNREALKFASLDCWKVTAQLLPENITVQTFEFKDGKHYSLSGVAPTDQNSQLIDFNEALRKTTTPNGQLMFDKVNLPVIKLNPGGNTLSWNFDGELARAEETR